jgi:hypothetical protein
MNAHSRSDLLKYTPGKCGSRSNEGSCSEGRPGVKCVWSEEGSCEISGQGVGLGKAQCSTLHDVMRSEMPCWTIVSLVYIPRILASGAAASVGAAITTGARKQHRRSVEICQLLFTSVTVRSKY